VSSGRSVVALSAEPSDSPATIISSSLRDQIHAFKTKLNDFTRNNPLLYFKELKVGSVWLPDIGTPAIAKLLDGDPVTPADFQAGADVKVRANLREIHLKSQANAEERGLQTLFVALGFATWSLSDNRAATPKQRLESGSDASGAEANPLVSDMGSKPFARDPFAPLVLLPVEIQEANRPGADPKILRAGDLQVNGALLAFVEETYNVRIDGERLIEEAAENLEALLAGLRARLATLPAISFPMRCVIGNFNFQKMAMVADLTEHIDLISESDLVQAISGDVAAQAKLSSAQEREAAPADLDTIPAHDELFVLDADSSQQRVLHAILRSNTHAVIQGPPGTGKSQTIANLIAALIGDGKRVLFVAEKRAALDAVRKRLTKVGLAHLVLDLHGADVKRKKIYEGLEAADRVARSTPRPDVENTYTQFEAARSQLNEHDRALHEKRPECDQSLYELIVRLAAIPELATCEIRLSLDQLQQLPAAQMQKSRALFAEAAALAPFFARDSATPWARAEFTDEHAVDAAIGVVAGLAEDLADLLRDIPSVATRMGVPGCATLADLSGFATNFAASIAARAAFEPSVFDVDIAAVVRTLRPHEASIGSRALAFFNPDARATMKILRAAGRPNQNGHDLFLELTRLSTLPPAWCAAPVFSTLDQIDTQKLAAQIDRVISLSTVFRGIAKSVEPPATLAALYRLVTNYRRTQTGAFKALTAARLRKSIQAAGFDPVLKELERAPRAPALWPDLFEGIWLRSFIEKFSVADPRIAGFDRARFEEIVEEFSRLDLDRLNLAAHRIRRSAAENYFKAQKDFPEQAVVFRTNLARKTKQLPLRKLMQQAARITTALCPCWMASPLSVSQLTDPRSKFDVVVFDEASQVLPEDAITSIIRGTRVVIAGDRHQLPPTTFFAGTAESNDDDLADDERTADNSRNIESILDLLSIYVRPQSLEWHYRSLDERLIAFSNKEFYGNALITFPSREEPPPAMQHVLVDEPKRDGDEDSGSAEVLRVVELVLEHARLRPHESLGVIAMGIKHATRIEKALYETRRGRPDLDAFFADHGEGTFFCKNLERVQGDERDAIILSVGYGKNAKGDMVYRFGPLNNAGGERRLNVAVSRAVRRMTLVSSFRSIDLDDKKLNATGAIVLKRFIRFAETDGRDLGNDQANDKIPMNGFEADIYNALSARGLSLVSQWGTSSYRLDFAVQDPRAPGSFCLAIECDGATYHSAQTARDRDRIRQTHLEAQGWKFHRIWSTDWFQDRFGEIERAVAAYAATIASSLPDLRPPVELSPAVEPGVYGPQDAQADVAAQTRRADVRPARRSGAPIDTYTSAELLDVVRWIASDGLLRTEDEVLRETARELGYARVGARIDRTLRAVILSAKLP
jgi:very-short-patch-repair endonuclease